MGNTPIRIFGRSTGAHVHLQRAVADNPGGTPKLHLARAVCIHDDVAAVAVGIDGANAGAAISHQRLFGVGLQGFCLQLCFILQINSGLVNRLIVPGELNDGLFERHVRGWIRSLSRLVSICMYAPRVARCTQGHVDVALKVDISCGL